MMQKEYIYPGAIKNIKESLFELRKKNILLVRGNQSYIKSGAKAALIPILEEYNVIEFSDFSVNPKLEEAQIGYQLFKENNIDVIIAIGGGSVIDTAKIIKYLAIQENSVNAEIPFIVAPTTAGTGSEATHFAVVYINSVKHSWADNALIPTVSIVDANMLIGQSKYQIAVSGMDALCQAIESYWAKGATEKSRNYAAQAIPLLMQNIERVVNAPTLVARTNMANGANLAGKAINISKTTASHALSYYLTSNYGIPHGHATGITLGYFIELNLNLAKENEQNEIVTIMSDLIKLMGCSTDLEARQKFYNLMNKIGLKNSLIELGVADSSELIGVVNSVNKERLANHPVELNNKLIIDILNLAL